jgi:hypothetical protein
MDTRFGGGLDSDDYICMNFQRDINKITEVGLKSKKDSWAKEPADREFEVDYEKQSKDIEIDDEGVPWETA